MAPGKFSRTKWKAGREVNRIVVVAWLHRKTLLLVNRKLLMLSHAWRFSPIFLRLVRCGTSNKISGVSSTLSFFLSNSHPPTFTRSHPHIFTYVPKTMFSLNTCTIRQFDDKELKITFPFHLHSWEQRDMFHNNFSRFESQWEYIQEPWITFIPSETDGLAIGQKNTKNIVYLSNFDRSIDIFPQYQDSEYQDIHIFGISRLHQFKSTINNCSDSSLWASTFLACSSLLSVVYVCIIWKSGQGNHWWHNMLKLFIVIV